MSQFARTERQEDEPFIIGDCACPPGEDGQQPHAHDEARFRLEIGAEALERIGTFGWARGAEDGVYDRAAERSMLIKQYVVSWNLQDDDGRQVPVTIGAISMLKEAPRDALAEHANALYEAQTKPVPKGSSGASARGSRASRPRTRKARRRPSSTTS